MDKEELLEEMSISELREAIHKKQIQKSIDRYGAKKETKFNLLEGNTLTSDGDGTLYRVMVEDGCEGWEALVEVDRDIDEVGNYNHEDLVLNHMINFMIDNDYYQPGDIEDIRIEGICRYSRPIFKIHV
jgi:hypothetical protein